LALTPHNHSSTADKASSSAPPWAIARAAAALAVSGKLNTEHAPGPEVQVNSLVQLSPPPVHRSSNRPRVLEEPKSEARDLDGQEPAGNEEPRDRVELRLGVPPQADDVEDGDDVECSVRPARRGEGSLGDVQPVAFARMAGRKRRGLKALDAPSRLASHVHEELP
jgi:hypothetical protein